MPRRSLGALGDLTARNSAFWVFLARRAVAVRTPPWCDRGLSWDDHILELCKTINYYVHVLRWLNKIFPKQLLLKMYNSYIQSQLDYGLSIWGCTTEVNLDRTQRIQNFCARIICKNYDFINTKRNIPCWFIEDTDHSSTQRLFSKCPDVQSYTCFGTSLLPMIIILKARKV